MSKKAADYQPITRADWVNGPHQVVIYWSADDEDQMAEFEVNNAELIRLTALIELMQSPTGSQSAQQVMLRIDSSILALGVGSQFTGQSSVSHQIFIFWSAMDDSTCAQFHVNDIELLRVIALINLMQIRKQTDHMLEQIVDTSIACTARQFAPWA